MRLEIKKITNDFADMKKLTELNNEAFPKEERVEVSDFLKFARKGKCDFLAFYDKQEFIGFTFLMKNEDTAYLCFFAVESSQRSKGYGTKILNILKKRYEGKQLVVDLERDDVESDNAEQRKSRKKFYFKSGFEESGYILSYSGMSFEVLYCGESFDRKSYENLFKMTKNTGIEFVLSEKNPFTQEENDAKTVDEGKFRFKEQSWFPNTVATCSAVLLYIAVTHLDMVWKLVSSIGGFVSPIVLGVIIAYLINPIMVWYKNHFFRKVKKNAVQNGLSVSLAFISVVLVMILLLTTLIPQLASSVANFIDNIGSYRTALNSWANGLNSDTLSKGVQKLLDSSQGFLDTAVSYITDNSDKLLSISASIGSKILTWLIGFILAIYFLADKDNIMNSSSRLLMIMLKEEKYKKTVPFLSKCNEILSRYITYSLIDGLIVGVANAIFMLIAGMSYTGLVSVVVGITNLIPTFGPFIGGAIGAFILLLVNPSHMIVFLVFTIVLQIIDGYVLKPKLFGDTFGVSGLLILIAIILGGRIFGVIGILLAIPVIAILDYIYKTIILKRSSRE